MQKIDNIEIKNFKSIRHQKIEGCKRINVFIGYPNVGKSNILEALSLFSINKPDIDFSSFVRMEELTTLFFDGNVNEKIEIRINKRNRIHASLSESNKEIRFCWHLSNNDASFDKMEDLDNNPIVTSLHYTKNYDENRIRNWESNFKIQSQSSEFIEKFGNSKLAPVKKYNFQKKTNYQPGKYDSLAVPGGENLFDIIYTHPDIRKEVAGLFEIYNLKLLFNSTENKFSILKNLSEDVIFAIPYKLVADTLQRLIFYKTAILSNKNSVLLFEEPEAHMFPPYISKFTSDIMYDENDNQYFIATHSPFVLNDLMENLKNDDYSIYTVGYNTETGETLIRKMTDEELHEIYQFGVDIFLNLENYLPYVQQ